MRRLAVFDFDGTLIDSPQKEEGKKQWEKVKGEKYPYDGWWGRKESLDTDVFNIKPFPHVLAQLEKEKATPDTAVVIITSRMEKLRPEIEKIMDMYSIVVDDVLLKRGNEGKGDVILKIKNYNQDLKEIVVYDDFMNRDVGKIAEYTKITDQLSDDVEYTLYFVNKDKIGLLEGAGIVSFKSTNRLLEMISEEIEKLN